MIFDSEEIAGLRRKYEGVSDYLVPRILRLDRLQALASERSYLERAIQCATGAKRSAWFKGLVNEDDGQHLGAWFEMMLFGWLEGLGQVEIEPDIEGDKPDFGVTVGRHRVLVEAKALALEPEERKYENYTDELLSLLRASSEPFEVDIVGFVPGSSPPDCELVGEMLRLLAEATAGPQEPDTADEEEFDNGASRRRRLWATDRHGNTVSFLGTQDNDLPRTAASRYRVGFMDSTRAWEALDIKAQQHRAVGAAGQPYVIALLLESITLDRDAGAEGWFGRLKVELDRMGVQWDRSGALFLGGEVWQHHVSGVLVFEERPNRYEQRRELRAYWIQNPYATVPLEGCLFQTQDRLVVLHQGPDGYGLGWVSGRGTEIRLPPDRRVTGP